MSIRRISLHRSAFRAWLAGQEPETAVGRRIVSCECPLAHFLRAQGAAAGMWVSPRHYSVDGVRERPLPLWARRFVLETDTRDFVSVPVTAAEALAVLESIRP